MEGASMADGSDSFCAALRADAVRRSRVDPNAIYSAAVSACSNGTGADVITYNATISACEKGKQWQRALQLLEEAGS